MAVYPNYLGLLAAGLSVAVFHWVYERIHHWSFTRRVGVTAVSFPPAIPALCFGIYYLHWLPEEQWMYELRSWRGSEWLFSLLGVFFAGLASLLPRRLLSLSLLVLSTMAVIPFAKPISGPIANVTFKDKWQDGVCWQSTPSTCGPASVATVLASLGLQASEKEIARAAFSSNTGTEAWYLARFIRSKSFSADFAFARDPLVLPELPMPAVVGVKVGDFGHFIAVLRKDGDNFVVADPMQGREVLPLTKILKRYRPTGFYMTMKPGQPADL